MSNQVEPHVVRILEEMLEHAKAGRITSVAVAIAGPDTSYHSYEASYSGDHRDLAFIRAQLAGLSLNLDQIIHEQAGARRSAFFPANKRL